MKTTNETTATEILKPQKNDVHLVDPRTLVANEEFNVRVDYGNIDELAHSIGVNGVLTNLSGYKKGDNWIITDGFRRHRAIKRAIELGYEIARVPIKSDGKDTNEEDRMFNMFIKNDGKRLTTYEESLLFRRLSNNQFKPEEIAKRIGRSKSYVETALFLSTAPKAIQNKMAEGKISEGTVIEILKSVETPEEQIKLVDEAIENFSKDEKTTKTKATLKNIKSAPISASPIQKMNDLSKKLEKMTGKKAEVAKAVVEYLKNKKGNLKDLLSFLE